jgi:hypothetical protein
MPHHFAATLPANATSETPALGCVRSNVGSAGNLTGPIVPPVPEVRVTVTAPPRDEMTAAPARTVHQGCGCYQADITSQSKDI